VNTGIIGANIIFYFGANEIWFVAQMKYQLAEKQ
jgi:hypothetical protein